MYLSDQMLRNLTPQEITASQQRESDQQLGQATAALTRWGHRLAAQLHAAAVRPVRPGHQPTFFRKAGPARHRAPHRA